MRKLLLSIKPSFVEQIRLGLKIFEYRRKIFKDSSVTTILIYSSSPVCKVVGECKIACVHSGNLKDIWEKTFSFSGISKEFYYKYFEGLDTAFAIELSGVSFFDKPKSLSDYNVSRAPQSYQYIDF